MPATSNVVAAAPRNNAYDSALANCRELGGYWTGSSCRAAVASRPLACAPGWAWSSDVGECQWDGGGRCPPWQIGAGGACLSDLACRGGRVRMSGRGYPVCDCPIGTVTFGNYPSLRCVPSIARIAPLLIAPLLGNAGLPQQGFIGAQGRASVGQAFGNRRFGAGQFGQRQILGGQQTQQAIPVATPAPVNDITLQWQRTNVGPDGKTTTVTTTTPVATPGTPQTLVPGTPQTAAAPAGQQCVTNNALVFVKDVSSCPPGMPHVDQWSAAYDKSQKDKVNTDKVLAQGKDSAGKPLTVAKVLDSNTGKGVCPPPSLLVPSRGW